MEQRDTMDRKMSFNPEAATFSPVATPAQPADTSVTTSDASPTGPYDSPLQPTASPVRPNLIGVNQSLEAVSIDELASMGVPVEALTKRFEQHSSSQALNYIGGSLHDYIHPTSAIDNPSSLHPPSSMLPSYNAEPNFETADIDELNASLGLPGARTDVPAKSSPIGSHRTQTSQGPHDNALYGKLIDRALTKPLTADALAQYMQSRSESSDDTVRPPRERSSSFRTPAADEARSLRLVRPPPGFGQQQPRIVTEEAQQVSIDPAKMPWAVPRAIPTGYFQQQLHLPPFAAPLQSHAFRVPGARRIRSYTRTRRTDQGPEPSAADIYPDDAHWTPSQATPRYQYPTPSYVPTAPQPVIRAEDSTAWPTPAEVYDPKPKAPTSTHAPQMPETKEVHVPPTAEDFAAADEAILALLDELPEP